jgi:signal transduction histidine kinase
MRELLRSVLDRLDPDTHARCNLELEPGAATTGTWDIQLVERVLANLVSNAAKYSDPASPIDIQVTNLDAAVHVTVGDHGMGLSADELRQLFQRYTRTQRARDRGAMGAGLGLYVCGGIVQAHDGRIWAESDGVGQGAKFHMLLPAARS